MDSVSVSAGGRVAKIYMHGERQRKITSMMNGLETKRLEVIKRQIADDKATERHLWDRTAKKIFQSNDDIKAFQKALLRRISVVKEKSKLSSGIRPLLNLGRYGGATIDQIKADSVKYKPIRNPEQRRLIKTRILLEQGKRTGQIKTFQSSVLGDITESILQLEKVTKPPDLLRQVFDVANLDDVEDAGEEERNIETSAISESENEKVVVRRRRIILPPLQVSRSIPNPNMNYYRQISAQYKEMRAALSKDNLGLSDIPEEYVGLKPTGQVSMESAKFDGESRHLDGTMKTSLTGIKRSKSTARERLQVGSRRKYYEWDYSRPLGPVTTGKYLADSQKFWRPNESVAIKKTQRIALPKIS